MNRDMSTRQTLLISLRDQYDEKSWEEFVQIYHGYVYAVIRNMKVSHHDAEDLAQSVILKAWEKLPEFNYSSEKGRFRGWLTTVTRHIVVSYIRKRTSELSKLEKAKSNSLDDHAQPSLILPEIEEIAETEWKAYVTNLAWNNIKDSFSDELTEAFLMLTEGKTSEEVCKETGIPLNNLYVYKGRIKKRLAQEIKRLDEELG